MKCDTPSLRCERKFLYVYKAISGIHAWNHVLMQLTIKFMLTDLIRSKAGWYVQGAGNRKKYAEATKNDAFSKPQKKTTYISSNHVVMEKNIAYFNVRAIINTY